MEAAMGVAGSATALAAASGDVIENVVVANCTVRHRVDAPSLPSFLYQENDHKSLELY